MTSSTALYLAMALSAAGLFGAVLIIPIVTSNLDQLQLEIDMEMEIVKQMTGESWTDLMEIRQELSLPQIRKIRAQVDPYGSRNAYQTTAAPADCSKCCTDKSVTNAYCLPGEKGHPGYAGDDGPNGDTGNPGRPGEPYRKPQCGGHSGYGNNAPSTNPLCIPCPAGPPGRQGYPGKPGYHGPKGPSGPPGNIGKPGFTGKPGYPGKPGLRGKHGRTGWPGSAGANGTKNGYSIGGEKGKNGHPGAQGPHGKPGEHGYPGPHGDAGEPGLPGNKGLPGHPGYQGPVGPPGAPGKDAHYCPCPARSGGSSYPKQKTRSGGAGTQSGYRSTSTSNAGGGRYGRLPPSVSSSSYSSRSRGGSSRSSHGPATTTQRSFYASKAPLTASQYDRTGYTHYRTTTTAPVSYGRQGTTSNRRGVVGSQYGRSPSTGGRYGVAFTTRRPSLYPLPTKYAKSGSFGRPTRYGTSSSRHGQSASDGTRWVQG